MSKKKDAPDPTGPAADDPEFAEFEAAMERASERDLDEPETASSIPSKTPPLTQLKAPKFTSSCSVGGVEYPVIKGIVEVPGEHVASLLEHGFQPIEPTE